MPAAWVPFSALCLFPAASHLPKVLILQSASARAGADRTFSDQYLGQVRAGEQVKEEGTVPGLAASGLLVLLVAGRSLRMVHCTCECGLQVEREKEFSVRYSLVG